MEPMGPKIKPMGAPYNAYVDPSSLQEIIRESWRRIAVDRWQEAGMPRYTLPVWPEPPPCAIAEAAFGAKAEIAPVPAVPDTDRMWDMLVLAARASRYGG